MAVHGPQAMGPSTGRGWVGHSSQDGQATPRLARLPNPPGDRVSLPEISIDYGLAEMFNHTAIRHPPPSPANHADWGLNIPDIEALIPLDALDNTVIPVFRELPQWEETEPDARDRYLHTIQSLADRHPSENLLLITHGEAVKVTVSTQLEDAARFRIMMDYCGYAQLKRQVIRNSNAFETGQFELLANYGQTGIHCSPRTPM